MRLCIASWGIKRLYRHKSFLGIVQGQKSLFVRLLKTLWGFALLYEPWNALSTQKFPGSRSRTEKFPCKAFKDLIRHWIDLWRIKRLYRHKNILGVVQGQNGFLFKSFKDLITLWIALWDLKRLYRHKSFWRHSRTEKFPYRASKDLLRLRIALWGTKRLYGHKSFLGGIQRQKSFPARLS
jgi:hypothetical protein